MNETPFQKHVKERLREEFPGCFIFKNDARQIQGIPDLLVLYMDMWAILEVKRSVSATVQPNQPWYIEQFNQMSFASFIYPENEEEVFRGLQETFSSAGITRSS
jgi:hypothetical protein